MIGWMLLLAAAQSSEPRLLNAPDIITPEDTPTDARMSFERGDVKVRISVARDGAVADCVVEESSGIESLDEQTCALFRARARFEPARNDDRNPVAADWRTTVHWLPPDVRPPLKNERMVLSFLVNADGTLASCTSEVEQNGTSVPEPMTSGDCVEVATTYGNFFPVVTRLPGRRAHALVVDVQTFVGGASPKLPTHNQSSDVPQLQFVTRYHVKADGHVDRCSTKVVRDVTPKQVGGSNCYWIRNSRFLPWQDAQGRAVETDVTSVTSVYLQTSAK